MDFGLVVWVAAARVSSNQEGAAEGSCDSLSVVASVGPGALVSVLLPFGMGEWEEEIFGSARASDVEMSEPLAHLFSGSAQRRTAPPALAREDDAELRAIQARLDKLQAEAAASGPGGYYSLHELANSRPASSPGK